MNRYACPLLGLFLGIAVGFGVGRWYGTHTGRQSSEQDRQRALAMAPMAQAVAAARDIPAGTTLMNIDLGKINAPSSTVQNAVRPDEANLILGRKVLFHIEAQKLILWSDIQGGREGHNQRPGKGESGTRAEDGSPSGSPQPSVCQPGSR